MLFTFIQCLRKDLPTDGVLGPWINEIRIEARKAETEIRVSHPPDMEMSGVVVEIVEDDEFEPS